MPTGSERTDVLQGTLALMVLQTLRTMGPQHGYGIARRIEQVSGDAIALNQGTLYPALVRLEQDGLIRARWGASENNRKAKFYALTRRGEKRLAAETARWSRVAGMMDKFINIGTAPETEGEGS
jgi:PadR family transcriptional regulator, regulatory protein PadR